MRNRRFLIPVMVLIAALAVLMFGRSSIFPAVAASPPKPKLVIIIVIDQFRNDYLDRFRPYFVDRGFNLLLSGARFTTCRYDYAVTATGPGHATLFTGAYPNLHGIIENEWFDRSLRRPVNCVEDPDTKIVDNDKGPTDRLGASPHYLMNTTLGDEMRLASGFQSKVVGISLKDRAAILPGGHTANAAYWYQASSGRFVSSTYYMQALPSWVAGFNAQAPAKEYCGKDWQALPETPGAKGELFWQFKPEGGEPCPDQRFLEWVNSTPFMNELELKFALAAIRNEHLGQGPATDLLAISLSVNDYIGHDFGPYSLQVADLTLRTDRALADFFAGVDHTVGLSNVWMALSGDHGVAPTPQFVREHHLGFGGFNAGPLEHTIEAALVQQFGEQRLAQSIGIPYVDLDQDALKRRQIPAERAEAIVAQAALRVPGVQAAFTRTELVNGNSAQDPLFRKALNSFETSRSGDVFLILKPFAVPSGSDTDTTHGSPWNYDAQVPLVFWGTAFTPGTYSDPVQPVDLAPTFAAALGLDQPSGAQGRPLSQALHLK
ncbi:MAG: alkaline phosphatase family protein [Acidobacteriia bacterium]|nr:alkaline phosphatase family protein [Terriglobia bacterium]